MSLEDAGYTMAMGGSSSPYEDACNEFAISGSPYQEHMDSQPDSLGDIDKGEALWGASPDQYWVLSDRDTWYQNPNYSGMYTNQPHPECHEECEAYWDSWAEFECYADAIKFDVARQSWYVGGSLGDRP